MPFTGFELKYPEYEVITPQTKLKFSIRSLNVQEEEKLKGSLVTPAKITEHLNKCLYESFVKKPAAIKEYHDFLKATTLKDRDALLFGLYHITYEEVRDYDVVCSSCKQEYPVTVQASDTFSFNAYPGDNVLSKTVEKKLPISKGVSVFLKQPTLFDEYQASKNIGNRPGINLDILTETLIIDRFEQEMKTVKEPKIYNERIDIIDAYLTLPARDKRIIYEAYNENFGKYGIELKMQTSCQSCGFEEVIDIDLVSSFFRMVYSA